MLLPNTPPTTEETLKYTISELEAKTVAQLKVICDGYSITYTTSDVKDRLIAKISKYEGISYTETDLATKIITQLQAICDGLGIVYDGTEDETALKALILA